MASRGQVVFLKNKISIVRYSSEFAAVSKGNWTQTLEPTALAPFRGKTVVIRTNLVLTV